MQLPALLRSSRLLTSLRGCALGNGGSAPAVAAAALRCTAPAPQSRCFAVPSHIPEADEPWPEGRRAPEGWWTDPSIATAAQAYEVFDASLEKFRHLRQRHIQEIIRRCKDGDDLQLAVKAMDKLMRFRRAEETHKPFNGHTGKMLVNQAVKIKAPAVAASALERYAELGLTPTGVQVQLLTKALGMQGDLDGALRLLAAARNAGVRTTPTMAYSVARTSINVGQRDRGVEVIKEMELNGVRIRPIIWQHLNGEAPSYATTGDADATDSTPPGAERTSSADGAEAADAAAADSEKEEEGATAASAAGAPPGVAS